MNIFNNLLCIHALCNGSKQGVDYDNEPNLSLSHKWSVIFDQV